MKRDEKIMIAVAIGVSILLAGAMIVVGLHINFGSWG